MTEADSLYPKTQTVQEISTLIDQERFDEAYKHLTTSLTEQKIYENTWDLSTYFFQLIEKPSDKLCNQYELFAQDALTHLAQHGNARELLIIMLEQSDRFISHDAFAFHMKLFLILIRRLPLKASLMSSINDMVTLLRCHLKTLPLPSISSDFSGKDLLVFNHDRRVVHLLDLTRLYVDFISQIRDYLSSSNMLELVSNLSKCLVQLLENPLVQLSYEPIESQESSSMTGIRPLLDCLFTIHKNPLQIILNNEQAHSVLVYLLLTKQDYFSLLPSVYSVQFYLFLSIPSIQYFSEDREKVMHTEKAAVLVSTVCGRLQPLKEFDSSILDHDQLHLLINILEKLMVLSPARQYAPLTVGAYRALFAAFDRSARYAFLRQQLAKTPVTEDSYRTLLCSLVKAEFLHDYRLESSKIYKGTALFQLLDSLCRLPNGVESDLMEIFDSLCSILNLVRLIGLVDRRTVNRTLLWTDYLARFNETMLKPLRKSIDIARAHYKLEVKNRSENRSNSTGGNKSADAELLVNNKPLSAPTQQEQLESLNTALGKFDILDYTLSSVNDTFASDL